MQSSERVKPMLVVNSKIEVPYTEMNFSFSRSGGPGGQNVNKVNTKVTLHWDIENTKSVPIGVKLRFLDKYKRRVNSKGELVLYSQRYRDQGRNVADCLDKLREMLLSVATVPKARKKTNPTKASQRRRIDDKKRRGAQKSLRKTLRDE
ncbi:MAG: ribosome-associated protein [Pirellulaceae bacterium]|jgi:ribosome-associated protein